MAKFNHYLDAGTPQVYKKWETGQEIHTAYTEGVAAYPYPRGSKLKTWSVSGVFLKQDSPSMGTFPAKSFRANKLRVRQFEEFMGDREMMPCYIEWFAGGTVESEDQPDDGWYIVTGFKTDYADQFFGIIRYTMDVAYVNPGIRGHKRWWRGGTLTTNFTQVGVNILPAAVDETMPLTTLVRNSFEGTVNLINAPTLASNPLIFNTTTPNLLKGGVHVFDTTVDSSRPGAGVSTSRLMAAPWVEVFGTDHRYTGDVVITNGILMILIPSLQQLNKICSVWWWDNTALAWQSVGDIVWNDNVPTIGTLLSCSLRKVGPEISEARISVYTTVAQVELILGLQRGHSFARIDVRPLTVDNSTGYVLAWVPTTTGWGTYNSTVNSVAASGSLAVATDYGFAGFYYTAGGRRWTAGWLYQNKPNSAMPIWSATQIGVGDTTSPKLNILQSYGFFVTPATPNTLPANTQTDLTGPGNVAQQFLHNKSVRIALG